jgi:hypothetical protein
MRAVVESHSHVAKQIRSEKERDVGARPDGVSCEKIIFIWKDWSIGSGVEVQTHVVQQPVGNTPLQHPHAAMRTAAVKLSRSVRVRPLPETMTPSRLTMAKQINMPESDLGAVTAASKQQLSKQRPSEVGVKGLSTSRAIATCSSGNVGTTFCPPTVVFGGPKESPARFICGCGYKEPVRVRQEWRLKKHTHACTLTTHRTCIPHVHKLHALNAN